MSHAALLSTVALVIVAVADVAAIAQELQRRQYDIPSEDAALALRDFSRQSGRQLLFPFDDAAGRRLPAVVGRFGEEEALARLLNGSGLGVTSRDDTTITVGLEDAAPARRGHADATPIEFAARPLPEEIVVTATKRPRTEIDVPASLTVLTRDRLDEIGATAVEDIALHVPGLSFSSNGPNSGVYSIRGVTTSSAIGNTQSPVAIYIDDFDLMDPFYPKITSNLRLFDIDRIEILRGPQGTLFGSGALGGAIRLITHKPDASLWAGSVQSTISGTQDGGINYLFQAMVNVPIVQDKLALRIVGYDQRQDGYVANVTRDESKANSIGSVGARAALRLTPTDTLTLTASYLYENDRPHDSDYINYGNTALTYRGSVPNVFLNLNRLYGFTAEDDLDFAKLTSATSYSDRAESAQLDFTRSLHRILDIDAPASIVDAGPSRSFSEEMRLTSPEGTAFQWLLGGLYLRNARTIYETIDLIKAGALPAEARRDGNLFFSDTVRETVETALFADASYSVERWTLTAGLRVFWNGLDRRDRAEGVLNNGLAHPYISLGEVASTPRFAISYKVDPTLLIYAQAAEGYRVGQGNTGLPVDPDSGQPIPRSYEPDTLWNYELGAKTALFDRRLMLEGALYDIEWSGIQLTQFSIPDGINFINNAGDAQIRGAELSLVARPHPDLELEVRCRLPMRN